jgi:hydroxymethylpyrimidine pyrophosphatase-like HAD family hydrolase
MAPIVEESGHRGIAICANGAVVMDLHTEDVLHTRALDATQSLTAVQRLREVLPDVTFAVERIGTGRRADVEFGREPNYVPRWPTPDRPPLAPIEELVAEGGVIKILARIPQAEHAAADAHDDRPAHARALGPDPTRDVPASPLVDALLVKASAALAGIASVTHSNPNDTLLEISALGATKAVALAAHVDTLGVAAHEVVAFGDQPNDLDMLRGAGTAFAVANAHPAVLAEIPGRTASVHEDGVAHTLNEILRLGLAP